VLDDRLKLDDCIACELLNPNMAHFKSNAVLLGIAHLPVFLKPAVDCPLYFSERAFPRESHDVSGSHHAGCGRSISLMLFRWRWLNLIIILRYQEDHTRLVFKAILRLLCWELY